MHKASTQSKRAKSGSLKARRAVASAGEISLPGIPLKVFVLAGTGLP